MGRLFLAAFGYGKKHPHLLSRISCKCAILLRTDKKTNKIVGFCLNPLHLVFKFIVYGQCYIPFRGNQRNKRQT